MLWSAAWQLTDLKAIDASSNRAASVLSSQKDPSCPVLHLYTQQPALHKLAGDIQPQQYHYL